MNNSIHRDAEIDGTREEIGKALQMNDPIRQVYERFKHLDKILSDPDIGGTPISNIAMDLWLAVKVAVEGCQE